MASSLTCAVVLSSAPDESAADMIERRARYGFPYSTGPDAEMEARAPPVAHLAGR